MIPIISVMFVTIAPTPLIKSKKILMVMESVMFVMILMVTAFTMLLTTVRRYPTTIRRMVILMG